MMTPMPETPSLPGRLHLATTRLARILRRQSPAELTPTQLSALATVQRDGPLPVGALAEIEQVGAPTSTKVVDKLEEGGFVTRHPSPTDRRVSLVEITPAGEVLLADLRARKTQWLATRIDELTPDEVRRLADAIDILEAMARPGS